MILVEISVFESPKPKKALFTKCLPIYSTEDITTRSISANYATII